MRIMRKHPVITAIIACIIIGVAAFCLDIIKPGADVFSEQWLAGQGILLLQVVILEFAIAVDRKTRAEQKLKSVIIPISVGFRYGPTRGSYSEEVSGRSVSLHKLLLWVLPVLYLVNLVCGIVA